MDIVMVNKWRSNFQAEEKKSNSLLSKLNLIMQKFRKCQYERNSNIEKTKNMFQFRVNIS